MSPWSDLLQSPVDVIGLALYVLVFPVYHGLYPLAAKRSPHGTAKGRMDIMRRSWIEGLIERREIVAAAQQTRNLTMMNSLLGSAALILLGMTANILLLLALHYMPKETPAESGALLRLRDGVIAVVSATARTQERAWSRLRAEADLLEIRSRRTVTASP